MSPGNPAIMSVINVKPKKVVGGKKVSENNLAASAWLHSCTNCWSALKKGTTSQTQANFDWLASIHGTYR